MPSASKLKTMPRKKETESRMPRRRRWPCGAASTWDPTKLTTPTPAGSVQGQVLIERSPPIAAMPKAKSGNCSIELANLSK